MVNQRITELRKLMKAQGIDVYYVPSEDFHQSEYVGEYFKEREFISGFTGSAGAVVITQDEAYLWTDGRYFLQAENQLKPSCVDLKKMGEPGVEDITEFFSAHLNKGSKLAFDGRCVSLLEGKEFEALAHAKSAELIYDLDLVGEVWKDRPEVSKEKAFLLEEKYTGESSASKIARIRKVMEEKGADYHIISALDDSCWIFNIRGNDVKYSPLVLSYSIIGKDEVYIFIDEEKLNDEIKAYLASLNPVYKPYNAIYDFVKDIKNKTVLLDPNKMNYALYMNLDSSLELVEMRNPSIVFKAVKNDIEVKNMKEAHLKDGVAVTKFIYWLKQNIGKIEIDEIMASDKLEEFRAERGGYLWPSFAPISAYGANAAIVHYSASPESKAKLEAKGLYLSDTGANFYEGSTDITRTIALGALTEEEKMHYTLVLKSHIALASAKFLSGTSGYALDVLARKPFWDHDMNFNHGTGHGIGYLLNVHEAPSGFRYKINPARDESYPIEPNMLITNEPGIYIANSHGIRIENVELMKKVSESEYGVFLGMESITLAPMEMEAIVPEMLSEEEKNYLNEYHKQVFDSISPYLTAEEAAWLKENTKAL